MDGAAVAVCLGAFIGGAVGLSALESDGKDETDSGGAFGPCERPLPGAAGAEGAATEDAFSGPVRFSRRSLCVPEWLVGCPMEALGVGGWNTLLSVAVEADEGAAVSDDSGVVEF